MASEALISLLVDRLIPYAQEKLTLYAQEKVTLVRSARDEVGKLAGTLVLIQKVLSDAEQKQLTNDALKVWLAKLKDVAYDAEDILDEWHTKTALSRLQTGEVDVNIASGSTSEKVFSFLLRLCLCFKDVGARYDIGRQVKEIRERLDEIAKEREQYALVASDSHNESLSITPLTTSSVNVSEIYGRDSDKRIIMNMILSDSSSQGRMPVHVISIVGTGGFGKTTLAKLIFKEKEVESAFDFRIWVCVSQPFNPSRIAKEIVEQATKKFVPESHGLEALHRQLCDSVKGKRFLLTLDDVWTNDQREWEPLKLSLSEGASGSHIIVTTRSREVAMMVGSTHLHDLRVLSEEDSWSLLSHVALRGREQELQKFEKIGRKIASKCKGIPLAIQTLASLLCHKRSIQDWRDVANNNLWEIDQVKEFFLPSLLISYYSLSPVSKRCFSFCSAFPKDTPIYKSELVELWVANGFFGYEGNKELEKIGEDHFDILAMRSFFQDFERDSDEVITVCKMHDLVHDFAQFLSQGECLSNVGNDGEFDASKLRHLWTRHYNEKFYEAKNLRTLIGSHSGIVSHIDKLASLRTLNLAFSYSSREVPISVCGLLHLRCLHLSTNKFLSELPEAICNLYNLQTLDLAYCLGLRKLPERIGDLCNLRHLKIEGTDRLKCLPQGIKRLTFLRTLDKVIVSERNTEFKIGDLSHLHKLQGRLEIHGLGRMKDANEVAQAELNKKNAIGHLKLYFNPLNLYFNPLGAEETSELDMVQINTTNSVLERLEPPEHLEKLFISGYLGDRFPGWMHNSLLLSNLVEMELSNCVNCTQLPPMRNLESLETLVISNLRSMKQLNPDFFGAEDGVVSFPRLRKLVFRNMSELEEWNIPPFLTKDASMSRIMPNLRDLIIKRCTKLTKLPDDAIFKSIRSLHLEIIDCELLEKLNFGGDEGVSSEPLPLNNQSVQVANPSSRTMPNLHILESLRSLHLEGLPNWKGEERGECPSLTAVRIYSCDKLKVVPHYMFSPNLEKLFIRSCPLLEKLNFGGGKGVFTQPLPRNNQSIQVTHPSYSSLNSLELRFCGSLNLDLKDLQQFINLQYLVIHDCYHLKNRFQGEEWRSILSHVATIYVEGVKITESN